MGTTANTLKKSGKLIQNVGSKEIKFRTKTAVGLAVVASLLAANGEAREAGIIFGHGVATVAPFVGKAVVGTVEFLGGLFDVDGKSLPNSFDIPKVNLPSVDTNNKSASEITASGQIAISPGGVSCLEVISTIVANVGDSPISLATNAHVANPGSYNVAANSLHIPYPGDRVAIC